MLDGFIMIFHWSHLSLNFSIIFYKYRKLVLSSQSGHCGFSLYPVSQQTSLSLLPFYILVIMSVYSKPGCSWSFCMLNKEIFSKPWHICQLCHPVLLIPWFCLNYFPHNNSAMYVMVIISLSRNAIAVYVCVAWLKLTLQDSSHKCPFLNTLVFVADIGRDR